MADDKGGTSRSANQQPSTAVRLATASRGTEAEAEKQAEVGREATDRRDAEARAAEDAAPTGADFPERAAENIQGHQTAGVHPIAAEHKNSRAQTEPAILDKTGGSIPHGFVSSPTGYVPASAVGGAEALAQYQTRLKASQDDGKVSEETLRTMTKPEIRAAAHDRGIKIGEGGKNSLISRFLSAQDSK